jgi:hypothetical protein
MDQDQPKAPSKRPAAPPSAKDLREAKLAQALRANLRRRKGAPPAKPGGDQGPV